MLTALRCVSLRNVLLLCFLSVTFLVSAQTPGLIIQPSTYSKTVLNPNGDALTSATAPGFTTLDVGQGYSEIPYKVIPASLLEEPNDIIRGPGGQFSDLVRTTADESGLYVFNDGTNLLFRIRVGGLVSGSKGYSVLIDADQRMGASGTSADPNYKAATNGSNGNPGFELEVVLETNFRVAIYDVDGKDDPNNTPIKTFPINDNSQISIALSNVSGTPDYFYDFYVPISELKYNNGTSTVTVTATTPLRMSATTVMSPQGAIGGPKSDIFGASGSDYMSAWESVVASQPAFTPDAVKIDGTGIGSVCTAAPVVNGPISTTATSITGTWTKASYSTVSTATISVYKNGNFLANVATPVTSGGTWSLVVSGLIAGDLITAKAKATNESMCLTSNTIQVSSCTPATRSAAPTIECISDRGADGTGTPGATLNIYRIEPAGLAVAGTLTIPTTGAWSWAGPGSTGSSSKECATGQRDVPAGFYYVTQTEVGKCESLPGDNTALPGTTDYYNSIGCTSTTATPSISQDVIYSSTITVSGTTAASAKLRLFVNSVLKDSALAASNGSYSFPLNSYYLNVGDSIEVRALSGTTCLSAPVSRKVSCFIPAPSITAITGTTNVAVGSQLTGTSSLASGTQVTVYNASTGAVIGTTTVASDGKWTLNTPVVAAGTSYLARHTGISCGVGAASPTVSAAGQTSSVRCGNAASTINDVNEQGSSPTTTPNTVTGTLGSAVANTTVNLYQGGVLLGSQTISTTNWSIPVNTVSTGVGENKLYVGGTLSIGIKEGTNAEVACPTTKTISCIAPANPVLAKNSYITTNSSGQISVTITNSIKDVVYTLEDVNPTTVSGVQVYLDRSQSVYGNDGTISLTSYPLTAGGTYNLRVGALKLTSPGCVANATLTLTLTDKDSDGVADPVDIDDDNDGILDEVESGALDATGDADGDGILNYRDAQFCSLNTFGVCASLDRDSDGIINQFDLDTDNDGIPDIIEQGGTDADNDGKVDGTADSDSDGLRDAVDIATTGASGSIGLTAVDFDNDGIPNFKDLDADGDGILDTIESGLARDTNKDGVINSSDTGHTDTNSDGWTDFIDNQATLGLTNTDTRNKPNFLDIDSDDDGITDNVEGQALTTANPYVPPYKAPSVTDADGDGINDAYDNNVGLYGGAADNGIIPVDNDLDGAPDYMDTDSDNDNDPDVKEGNDFNTNGIADDNVILLNTDADGDGLDDVFEISINSGPDVTIAGLNGTGSKSRVQRTATASGTNQDWRNPAFSLSINSTLPVEFISFVAYRQSQGVQLTWNVTAEVNVKSYEIERSMDGKRFSKVGEVPYKATTTLINKYQYIDGSLQSNTVYYRLRQVDLDGKYMYSGVVSVSLQQNGSRLSVHPNPVFNKASFALNVNSSQNAVLSVCDMQGRVLAKRSVALQKGQNVIPADSFLQLPNGTYILVTQVDGVLLETSFIRQ